MWLAKAFTHILCFIKCSAKHLFPNALPLLTYKSILPYIYIFVKLFYILLKNYKIHSFSDKRVGVKPDMPCDKISLFFERLPRTRKSWLRTTCSDFWENQSSFSPPLLRFRQFLRRGAAKYSTNALWLLSKAVKQAAKSEPVFFKYGRTITACFTAGSVFPELAPF